MTTQHPQFSLKVTANGFNVFSGPGNSYDRVKDENDRAVFILPHVKTDDDPWYTVSTVGTTNTILGKYATKALWYRIRVTDEDSATSEGIDITGWIRAAHVESDDDLSGVPVAWKPIRLSIVSLSTLPTFFDVYSGPGISHDRIGSLRADVDGASSPTLYPLLGKNAAQDTWYEIQYDPTHPDCTGWIPAAQVQIHEAQASIQQEDLPVTWLPPLPAESLKLPFAEGDVHDITSLFNDPRRGPGGWDPNQRGLHKHEGIDWGCPEDTPVLAMIGGTVFDTGNSSGYGNYVTILTRDPGRGLFFSLTYAHLKSVTKTEGLVGKGKEVGISGNTGNSTGPHLHVHYVARDAEDKFSTVNWPDFFHSRNYQDFHAALETRIYHWPDTAALQAEIDAAPEAGRDRLRGLINLWIRDSLDGTATARLRVKPGAWAYMFPEADARFRYPSRPLAHYEIEGRYAVEDQPQVFTDTAPWWWQHLESGSTLWWKIKAPEAVYDKPHFPVLWVRDEDAEVIGSQTAAPFVPPTTTDLPRFLQKNSAYPRINVRRGPHTQSLNHDGEPVDVDNSVGGIANDKWVPITKLACDATARDHLWYQIPYDTSDASRRGWVRGDVVTVKGSLKEEDMRLFQDIEPKVPEDTTAHAKTQPNQVVPALPYPDEESRNPNTLTYAFEGVAPITGCSAMSPLWYQLQLTDTRRGWVLADQVTAHNTDGLDQVQPRLRRRLGSPAAIPVRNGPVDTGTVLAAIGDADRTWHALRGRDAAYPGWWRIRYDGPVAGWVRSNQVQTHGSLAGLAATWDPTPQLSLRPTTTLGLNVRAKPDATADRVGFIMGGSTNRYDILGKDADTATWWQIRYSPAVVGWVHGGYVRTHGSLAGLTVTSVPQLSLEATATNGLTVRSGPGTIHGQVGLIAAGSTDRYDILGKDAATAAWYQIRFSDTVTGWVDRDEVRTHGDLTGLTVTAVPQLSLKASTTDGLRVRSGPGTTHGQIASIAGGSTTKYDILGKDAAAATWYQIRFSDSLDGWVHGDYVQFHGDLTGLGVTWVPQLSLKDHRHQRPGHPFGPRHNPHPNRLHRHRLHRPLRHPGQGCGHARLVPGAPPRLRRRLGQGGRRRGDRRLPRPVAAAPGRPGQLRPELRRAGHAGPDRHRAGHDYGPGRALPGAGEGCGHGRLVRSPLQRQHQRLGAGFLRAAARGRAQPAASPRRRPQTTGPG